MIFCLVWHFAAKTNHFRPKVMCGIIEPNFVLEYADCLHNYEVLLFYEQEQVI